MNPSQLHTLIPKIQKTLNQVRIDEQDMVEQEARLGKYIGSQFIPGVSEHFFHDMKKTLMRWKNKLLPREYESFVALYDNAKRVELCKGSIKAIQKQKIANDIELKLNKHYDLRISTCIEKNIDDKEILSATRRYLKPKRFTKLLEGACRCRFAPNSFVTFPTLEKTDPLYLLSTRSVPSNLVNTCLWVWKDFNSMWSLQKTRVYINKLKKDLSNPHKIMYLTNTAGTINHIPVPYGAYTVAAYLGTIMPVTNMYNVDHLPPYYPTGWRYKKRTSFYFPNSIQLDMTEVAYSKYNIQHCFEKPKSYEVELEWNGKGNPEDFVRALKKIVYTI
jgi:hypothetical protein